jgi:hypothetical protein
MDKLKYEREALKWWMTLNFHQKNNIRIEFNVVNMKDEEIVVAYTSYLEKTKEAEKRAWELRELNEIEVAKINACIKRLSNINTQFCFITSNQKTTEAYVKLINGGSEWKNKYNQYAYFN